jgi:hypothetical protein
MSYSKNTSDIDKIKHMSFSELKDELIENADNPVRRHIIKLLMKERYREYLKKKKLVQNQIPASNLNTVLNSNQNSVLSKSQKHEQPIKKPTYLETLVDSLVEDSVSMKVNSGSAKKKKVFLCPNSKNQYHTCVEYCIKTYGMDQKNYIDYDLYKKQNNYESDEFSDDQNNYDNNSGDQSDNQSFDNESLDDDKFKSQIQRNAFNNSLMDRLNSELTIIKDKNKKKEIVPPFAVSGTSDTFAMFKKPDDKPQKMTNFNRFKKE